MRICKTAAAAVVALALAACETGPNADTFCGRQPWFCGVGILTGLVVVAAIVIESRADEIQIVSDERLKRGVRAVGALPNGLPVYAFRYWNDDRVFVSVMAQDLLRDARVRHAVHQTDSGYYLVDLNALGLGVVGSRSEFEEAGLRALRCAEAGC